MGSVAASKLLRILTNLQNIVAIEILCACQALEFRDRCRLAPATKAVYDFSKGRYRPQGRSLPGTGDQIGKGFGGLRPNIAGSRKHSRKDKIEEVIL